MLILCSSATLYDINYTKNTIPIAIHFSASRRKPTGYLFIKIFITHTLLVDYKENNNNSTVFYNLPFVIFHIIFIHLIFSI